jgi:hypothetical protein
VALADQHFKVRRTVIREDSQPDQFEADFFIEEKTTQPIVPFTLDDLIAGLNSLKTNHSVPGTARVGSAVAFSLRWQ